MRWRSALTTRPRGDARAQRAQLGLELPDPLEKAQQHCGPVRVEVEFATQPAGAPCDRQRVAAKYPGRRGRIHGSERAVLDQLAQLRLGHSRALDQLRERDLAELVDAQRFVGFNVHLAASASKWARGLKVELSASCWNSSRSRSLNTE